MGLYCVLRGGRSIIRAFRGLEEESCGPKSPLMFMELDSYGTLKWDLWVFRCNVEYYCLYGVKLVLIGVVTFYTLTSFKKRIV